MQDHIIYELVCDSCDAEYEVSLDSNDDANRPSYCPFCGTDIDLSDIEEEQFDFMDGDDLVNLDEWKD